VLNDFDLRGLRLAVTGGTSGLGLALVRNLTSRRARVAFVGRRSELVKGLARETGACGIVGDLGRKEDIHPTALEIIWNLGGLRLRRWRS
jgi:NAD(P)-dependent dehydrogenase (short-subunit alcohol dehydrogenase family)